MNDTELSYKDWHIPLSHDHLNLTEAYSLLAQVKARQEEIPLMVQLVENPKYSIPGFQIFHGAVDLQQHDYIHIVLGRGLLPIDEAFTIGFTMGTTNKVSTTEEALYALVSKYFYPRVYQFNDAEISVFRDAVRLAYISDCQPLNEFDFCANAQRSLREIRGLLGVECDLLKAYFKIELARNPDSRASQRLLNT